MTTPIPEAAVEAAAFDAAEDALATRCHTGELHGDGGCDCPDDDTMRLIIRAALTAARPLIEAEIRGQVAEEIRRGLSDVLCSTAKDEDGWLSDAQYIGGIEANDIYVTFCGEGSIDIEHVADIAATIAERTNDEPA